MKPFRLLRHPGRTWPPEHSVPFRATSTGAVCVAVAACAAQGELPVWYAALAAALVCLGSFFSHRRRTRPLPYLKVLLGAAMLGAFAWFFVSVSSDAATGQLSVVEGPLAVLFTAMQAAHAFDMPSRRDLGFSLAGSATLMAVAGAQAIDLSFGVYVALWAVLAVGGLHESWSSMAGGAALRPLPVVASTAAALLVAALLVVFLPAPRPPSLTAGSSFSGTGALTAAQPTRLVPATRTSEQLAASADGPTGVGGFLGFAGPLDTALRPGLGDETVLRVRADRPTYWVAETFDTWSGQSWTETRSHGGTTAGGRPGGAGSNRWSVLRGSQPFVVAPNVGSPPEVDWQALGTSNLRTGPVRAAAEPDYQTFYLAASASNLVLHADQPDAVWIPTRRLFVSADDTIRTGEALGAGSVYSVESTVATPSPAALARANGATGLTTATEREDLQLPHPYPRVAALARRVTMHDATVISKIHALERWLGAHTRYTLDIPPLSPGQDTVDEFLFGTRRGFCEQISTTLAVMLRTLGVPAREAVGYVPGQYDPITGLYDVEAKDAHAWVQVWFPGYGWQSFDPTAYVPLANPSPASTIGHDMLVALDRVPLVPTVAVAALLGLAALVVLRRRRTPRTWSAKVTRELERAARRAGVDVPPGATLTAVAAALDAALDAAPRAAPGGPRTPPAPQDTPSAGRAGASDLADAAARAAWGGGDPQPRAGRHLVQDARGIRRRAGHLTRR